MRSRGTEGGASVRAPLVAKMDLVAFIVAISLGVLSGRITTVGARGGVEATTVTRAALGAASVFVTFSLIVWGFASLSWYWPIVAFLIGSAVALMVTQASWPGLFTMQPVLDAAVIALGLFLWVVHWPF